MVNWFFSLNTITTFRSLFFRVLLLVSIIKSAPAIVLGVMKGVILQ